MKARVVIVGGGVIGLSVAYHLSRLGWRDVVVVERDHLNAGASGRCGGGVREQWSSAMNIDLMRRSIELFRDLAVRTGENIWFRQGGYLFLAKTEEQAASLETSVRLQNDHGVPTRLLSKSAVRRRCPYLNTEDVMVGTFNPNDGTLFPFSVVWAYARAVADYGNTVMTHTRVTGIEREGDRMIAVQTDKGRIETSFVVNAAGAWSPEIGNMVGIDLPNHPEKHEAIVTEALRGFLGPNLVPMDSGLYVSQTMRGEIYACLGVDKGPAKSYTPTFRFLTTISRLMIDLIPRLANVKILRQWGGFYDITPDTNPILGPMVKLPGFIQCHGFMGHGFMMAPVIGELLAAWMDSGRTHPVLDACAPERFARGGSTRESMIIG